MFVILVNCVTLGMYRPCEDNEDGGCQSFRCKTLALIDDLIFGFFAIEMVNAANFQPFTSVDRTFCLHFSLHDVKVTDRRNLSFRD